MPAKSVAQRQLMAIAEHNPSAVSAKNKGVLKMSHTQLHDFAATSGLHKEHVSEHLHTPHHEPHPGKKIDGTPYDGKLAGNSTPHEHDSVTHHYEKGKGH